MGSELARRRAVVLTMASAFFLLLLDSSILNTSLPRVAASMNVQPLALSSTITGYLLASIAAMPLSGWLSDRFGSRRVYLVSIAIFTLASAACGASMSLSQLVVARIVQGAAGGTMLTVGRIIALRGVEKTELLSVTSLLTWPALMAPVVGPPLGGWITTYLSWRWNFLLNVPLGLLGMILTARFVPRDGLPQHSPLDWRGALLTAVGLGALFGGLEFAAQAPEQPAVRLPALVLVPAGAIVMFLAVRHLNRVAHPVISLAPLKHRTFALSTFAAGTYSMMCLQATPYLLPLTFQLSFGASAAAAGALMLPYFLGNLLVKLITTPVLRRFGFKQVLIVDGLLAMVFIALCGTLGSETPWPLAALVLAVAGATRSTLMGALNTLCFADVEHEQRAAAATLSSVSMLLSQSLGIVVSTLMLAGAMAAADRAQLTAADFKLTFFGVAVLGLMSVMLYTTLSKHAGEEMRGLQSSGPVKAVSGSKAR